MAQPPMIRLSDISPRSRFMTRWERTRRGPARWAIEFAGELTATFLYTFAGVGATAAWVLGDILGASGLGSLFQTGLAYAVGAALAMIVCYTTSRGYFNPSLVIYAIVSGKCTPFKGLRYIIAQIIGAYLACITVYFQYHNMIIPAIEILKEKGLYDEQMFSSSGPAGIFALYAQAGSNLGYIFLNEFVCDFVIALVLFASVEPTNFLSPPSMMPWTVALGYSVIIWGFAPAGISGNAARDLGGRLAAMTLWGTPAAGGRYALIASLTSIPATLLAAVFYEVVFQDSARPLSTPYIEFGQAMKAAETYGASSAGVLEHRGGAESVYTEQQKAALLPH